MTNNELSRKVLKKLLENNGGARFKGLVEELGVDARAIFKNLFFLEEKGYVQLSTSHPSEAVYPLIHIVRLRDPGARIARDKELMDGAFPVSEAADAKSGAANDANHTKPLTFAQALDAMARRIRESMDGDERDAAIERIESLLGLSMAGENIRDK